MYIVIVARFQQYLRRLSAAEWEAVWTAAQQQLGKKSQELLRRLREQSHAIRLSPSEKELTKYIERWHWKWLYIRSQEGRSFREALPTVWVVAGARAYHQKGLSNEALRILHTFSAENAPFEHLLLRERIFIATESMQYTQAYRDLFQLERRLRALVEIAYRQRIQLLLWRLLYEQGGSYTESAKRILQRLARLRIWDRELPTAPEDKIAEINLRSLYALCQGDLAQAIAWYQRYREEKSLAPSPILELNAWLYYIMERRPPEVFLSLLPRLHPPFSPQERAVLLNRLLLTILHFMPPREIEAVLEQYEGIYLIVQPKLAENELVWAQCLWLTHRFGEAFQIFSKLSKNRHTPLFLRLQAMLLRVMAAIDAQAWHEMYISMEKALHFLRKYRNKVASAQLLARQMRLLYRARLRQRSLRHAVQVWRQHLNAYPTESLMWRLTLLPVWIESRLRRIPMEGYRSSDHTALVQNILSHGMHLLTAES